MVVGDRKGRGHSIYDNVVGAAMWIINDENPEAEKETCVTLIKSKTNGWFVWACKVLYINFVILFFSRNQQLYYLQPVLSISGN